MRRLIVLIPDQGVDGAALAQRVRSLATPCELDIALISVLESGAHPASAVRLRLATMASQIGDERVRVETSVLTGQSWAAAVRRVEQPGDIVICCAEHRVPTATNGRQPLYHMLEWLLDVPVYVLAGLYTEPATQRKSAPPISTRLTRWLALLAILASFFVAQVQISHLPVGLAHTALILFAALIELGLIVIWSSLA